jgi:hypothetical protein
MNERIKELSSRARDYAREYVADCKQYGYYMEHNEYDLQFEAKFAELIVRECARAVNKVYEDAEPDHGCYDWATFARGSDVLKHFEVEE